MPFELALMLIILAFGAGLYVSHRIDAKELRRRGDAIEVLVQEAANHPDDNELQALVQELGSRASTAEWLIENLGDSIEHACELMAEGDNDQARYVVFGLDDRLKTQKPWQFPARAR